METSGRSLEKLLFAKLGDQTAETNFQSKKMLWFFNYRELKTLFDHKKFMIINGKNKTFYIRMYVEMP